MYVTLETAREAGRLLAKGASLSEVEKCLQEGQLKPGTEGGYHFDVTTITGPRQQKAKAPAIPDKRAAGCDVL